MMNSAKVNSPSESSWEERGGVSRALSHLKENYTTRLALKELFLTGYKKGVFFTLPMKHFNQTM